MKHSSFNIVSFYRMFFFCSAIIISVLPSFTQDLDEESTNIFLKDTSNVKIFRLNFNSRKSDFCPVFYKDGIIFYSNREKSEKIPSGFISNTNADIFFVNIKNDSYSDPVYFNELIGYVYYEGAFTFYNNDNKMLLSKYTSSLSGKIKEKDKLNGLRIFNSDIDTSSNKLYTLDMLSFNVQGFSSMHPTVSSDGNTVIFASDLSDGNGGTDLYITKQNRGFWSPPENMGDRINSQNDEYFPYLFQDSILIFTSNRPGGVGKFDVYITTLNNTSAPLNLGTPINSEEDDFSLIISADGDYGYFSSNREDTSQEDIYRFDLDFGSIQELVKSVFYDDEKKEIYDDIVEPVDISLNLDEGTQNKTDESIESVSKENKQPIQQQEMEIKHQNNLVYRVQIAASKKQLSEKELKLKYKGYNPVLMFQEEGWHKYYIGEFDNYFVADKFKKESGVKDAFIAAYKQDEKLILMDAIRAQYQEVRKEYKSINKDIPGNWEIIEQQEIYFDLNSFDESNKISSLLNEIVSLIDKDINYQLAIFAFADYWGSSDYNLALSTERGRTMKNYFVGKGISENRIIIRSYGEKYSGDRDTTPLEYSSLENEIDRKVEFIIYKKR